MVKELDTALIPFLNSVTTAESESALAALLAAEIEPAIVKTLRGKFRDSLKPDDFSQTNQDALEIAGDVKLILIDELIRVKANNNDRNIANLKSFVTSVTLNAYRQHLRSKYPLRQQLKNKLRYLLMHHPNFALWENERDGWVCGFQKWSGENKAPGSPEVDALLSEIRETTSDKNLRGAAQTIDLLSVVFEAAKAPIGFNDLIAIVAEMQGVKDQRHVSADDLSEPDLEDRTATENTTITEIEQREHLKMIWAEICELPVRHRVALLLNLKDRQGDCVVWLFPILRIASIKQIAEKLEFPPEEFAAVWRELPWEDLKIAEYLGLTRQQIINLRQSARGRLARLFGQK